VILRSSDGTIIDEATYGNWDDGDVRDNAAVAIDPFSLARVGNTYYSRDDFRITATPTKGASNKITDKKPHDDESAPTIIISELVPHPSSLDPAHEFIELHNPNNIPVNLGGWELLLLDDTQYLFPLDEVLAPREYRAYSRKVTNFALKNSGGERVRLYAPYAAAPSDEVRYVENTPLGSSYSRAASGIFQWSKNPTPGAKNEITRDNRSPRVVIHGPTVGAPNDFLTFNASDTTDDDGDQLTFHWEFGDAIAADGAVVHHTYQEEDAYPILLTVSDGKESIAHYHHIVIEDRRAILAIPMPGITSAARSVVPAPSSVIPVKGSLPPAKPDRSLSSEISSAGKIQSQLNVLTPLDRIRTLKSGTAVRVEGVVAVVPGIMSANYFYIAGSGIQIWNPKKEFPALERGDRIVVSGTVRKNGSEHAVRIDGADAIRIVAHEDAPIPYETSLADIGESREGELVRVAAQVADTRWPNVYLEDGDVRVRAYITRTTDIAKEQFRKGEEVTVTGIVSETSAGYRILPRDRDDIEGVTKSAEQVVLGEKVEGPQILTLPERADPRSQLFKYFLATLLATLVIVGVLGYQYLLDRKKRE
ncbi:MAG: PKD domain-containing protein, partial [Patescibacteria group bacterium]